MGCSASRSRKEDDHVVSLCGERKRLIKSAVERRYAFAQAYSKYNQSLYAVALAIRLFVSRYSSPASPLLITFPSLSTEKTGKLQDCTFPERENGDEGTGGSDEEEDDDEERVICEHFHDPVDRPRQPTQSDFGWDFFNPFDGFVNGFSQSCDVDLRALREAEGIPELEEEDEGTERNGVKTARNANVSRSEQKGEMAAIDKANNERELLEALKNVEAHFMRAYRSGVEISKMLEINLVHLQSDLEEIKESSNKLIQSTTWRRSTSSRPSSCKSFLSSSSKSSSCKSFLSSSSKSSSTWTEFSNDLFDECVMSSGSHSLTLGRLGAWEKKLYDEVKAGYQVRKAYEQKVRLLRNQDGKAERTKGEVRDLYSRVSVTVRTVESISKRIQKLRDEELLPQLVELLNGLTTAWKVSLESLQAQKQVILGVKAFAFPAFGKFSNEFHRLVTLQLEAEIQNWCSCFAGYVSSQKAYIQALEEWLSKFVDPDIEFYSRERFTVPHSQINGPPSLSICHDWLASLEMLSDKAVTCAMKSLVKDIRYVSNRQGAEQQQKRRVDGLAKELDRRIQEFQRAEGKILETKLCEEKAEADMRQRVGFWEEKKVQLEMLKNKLEKEKANHHASVQETEHVILNGFQTGFFSVFESLIQFSRASVQMYSDLAAHGRNT